MTRRVTEIEEPPFRKKDDRVPVGEHPFVYLRLDRRAANTCDLLQTCDVDLVVEVANVPDDRLMLHLPMICRDDVPVAGRSYEDVRGCDDVIEPCDLVAMHRSLQRTDRVDFGDDDPSALPAQRLGATLTDVTEATNNGGLPRSSHRWHG